MARGESPFAGVSISSVAHITEDEMPERQNGGAPPFYTKQFASSPPTITRDTIRTEIQNYVDTVLAEAIGKAIGQLMSEANAKMEAAMKEFTYRGQWNEGRLYRKGNFVSLGAVWHANTDTQSRPGMDGDWAMAIAKPKDGRDGVPPPEPEPRTVRAARASSPPSLVAARNNK
jgi:hypothetical protein